MTFTTTRGISYWLGIDESNHGRTPEIYVSVLSTDPEEIIRSAEALPKLRKKVDLDRLFADYPICFAVLNRDHINEFGYNGVKAPTIRRLIKGHISEIDLRRTIVLVDGEAASQTTKDLEGMVSKDFGEKVSRSQFQFIEEGDIFYPVINLADRVAYQLYLIYKNISSDTQGPFDDRRVPFDIMVPSTKSHKDLPIKRKKN